MTTIWVGSIRPPAASSIATAATSWTSITRFVAASDVDNGASWTYAITGGNTGGAFDIDTNTGVLTFGAAPDFENPTDSNLDNVYEVVVLVNDQEIVHCHRHAIDL